MEHLQQRKTYNEEFSTTEKWGEKKTTRDLNLMHGLLNSCFCYGWSALQFICPVWDSVVLFVS